MPDYKKLYFHLFGCLSTVLEQLEQHNYGNAQTLLRKILTDAEDAYLDDEDQENTCSGVQGSERFRESIESASHKPLP